MSNKTQWPEIVPVTFITPEEAEERGIELPSLPVEKNLDTLTRRTLWQNWGRDDGGWTHAVRLHPFLPLVKFAISAERGYYSNFFDGRCWIVEDHPYQADFKGEPGELGLGMGNPLLSYHMGAGETPYRNNRIALSEGRSFVEWMLFECKREAWADIICAELIEEHNNPTNEHYHREPLYRWWLEHLRSTKQGHKGAFYKREAALAMTPYIAATFETTPDDEPTVFEALAGLGMTGHEAAEAMRFRGWTPEDET